MEEVPILKVEKTNDFIDMYDLEVKDNHNFLLSNGILSHNSGKTYLTYKLGHELYKLGEEVWVLGIPMDMPDFIAGRTLRFDEIPPNTTTIISEAAVNFFSRNAMRFDQSDFMSRLAAIRHSGRNFIVETQSLRLSDITFMRLLDGIFFKSYSLIQDDMDRIRIHRETKPFMPTKVEDCLYIDNRNMIQFSLPLSDWWKEAYSTPYRNFRSRGEAYRFVIKLLPECDNITIAEHLSNKAFRSDPVEVERMRMLAEGREREFLLMGDRKLENVIDMGFSDMSVNDIALGRTGMVKAEFGMNKLQREALNLRIERDSRLYLRLNYCINEMFLDMLISNLTTEMNVILSVKGLPGTGKSYSAISLAWLISIIHKKLFMLNLYFRKEKLMGDIEGKRQDTMILDEMIASWGPGSGREDREFSDMEDTLRKRQIHFIHCSPQVRSKSHFYILETAGIDRKLNLCKLLVYTPDMELLGYITVKKPEDKITEEYENLKEKDSLTKVEKRVSGGMDWTKQAVLVMATPQWKKATSKSLKVSAIRQRFPNISISEAEELMNYIILNLE